jgi:type I restriction enzyme R subunit
VFDSVVVVTDRKVLDQQLQDTIYQFEHKQGVVQRIDENSAQLYDALQKGTRVIVTTIQKFPFVMGLAGKLPDRKYALIVDEAHSSQTGELAGKSGRYSRLSRREGPPKRKPGKEAVPDFEHHAEADGWQGRLESVSFFAFTATPKQDPGTLRDYGQMENRPPSPLPCGRRSRRIHPRRLKNTTYKAYFELTKKIQMTRTKKRASRAIARF